MASVEDARLAALQGLRAAYIVAALSTAAEDLTGPIEALGSTLQPLLEARGVCDASTAAISSERATLAFAVETAQVQHATSPTDLLHVV